MKATVYKEMSQTAEGRKELHTIMLEDVKAKMDALVESAPAANREAAAKMMDAAYDKISALGNSQLFNFFADDSVSERDFISYVSDILKGKF